jgi:hypothetical protein
MYSANNIPIQMMLDIQDIQKEFDLIYQELVKLTEGEPGANV